MPSEQQHRVYEIVAQELERSARTTDDWCWAWPSGVSFASGANGAAFEACLFVDRDRADPARARDLVEAVVAMLRRDHPEIPEPLRLSVVPTTRLEWAFHVVTHACEVAAIVDRERMGSWVKLGTIERRFGWSGVEDRIEVQMYAESSADEERARQLGETWLAELYGRHPQLAAMVYVVGESH
jgi:hypothetical protein